MANELSGHKGSDFWVTPIHERSPCCGPTAVGTRSQVFIFSNVNMSMTISVEERILLPGLQCAPVLVKFY